jgi:hypothetical protein
MIKYVVIPSFLILGLVAQAQAGAGAFFGISYNFGASKADWGITAKVLSDDDANTAVAAAGVSFFPFANEKKFGVDLSGGYLFENGAVTLGWDFLQRKPQLGIGYVNTDDGKSTSSTMIDDSTDDSTDGPTDLPF